MTHKYKKMCEIYKKFASDWDCDFSDKAKKEMFLFESKGIGNIDISGFNASISKPNGYAVGKKWLNVQVSAWKKDFENSDLFKRLCMTDIIKDYPHWWLRSIGLI